MQNNSSIPLQAPEILFDDIVSFEVKFFDFYGNEQKGSIEVHKSIENDIKELFDLIHKLKFPLHSVVPISEFEYSDDASMNANNTSAFNFRTVALDPTRISNHGYGLAIDLNPVQNPYIKGDIVLPPNSTYDFETSGTLYGTHLIVEFMKSRGFIWGGDWDKPYVDYQHFHKELSLQLHEKYGPEIKNCLTKKTG